MQFFKDSKIDFMRYRKFFVWVSVTFLSVGIFSVFVHGDLNLGIDFAGGTQLTIKFQERTEIDRLRSLIAAAGVQDAMLQRFGEQGANEVMIKTPTVEGSEEGSRVAVIEALDREFNPEAAGFDLNRKGRDALAELLLALDPEGLKGADEEGARERYERAAEAILAVREDRGLIGDWAQIEEVEGAGDAVLSALRDNAYLGGFSVLGSENVGPQIGAELRRKGILAVVLSLIGMLLYIWFRFELRFGIGALAAVTHDVLITLGLFALAGFEFNLTTIAAFLTLVGYSVNDSVVVFDRVRENLRRSRGRPLVDLMNLSINQTLSRTILTSGTTLLAIGCLLVLGGDVLRGFAFIMTIGVVIGTYSSIYVASPFALLWEQALGREARARRRNAKAA